jgi:alkanesulfonate monooxygenase SsuD/methylene tetrahydromethanopterin reductase-like flavin-dependent oxidoreductase (luciferase family)
MTSIILDIEIGSRLDVTDAHEIAAAAVGAGVSAVRILDAAAHEVPDPTAVATYLAERIPALRWIVEAPTTQNAPDDLARQVLSFDRATAGRVGLALRTGGGDEVGDRLAAERRHRWAEYARVLTELWASFPEPGRPVLIADARDELAWDDVAALADVLVVSREQAPVAAWRFAAALERTGRRREEVAVLGRADMTGSAFAPWTARELADWACSHSLDGLEIVIDGDRKEILTLLRALGPWPRPAREATLRAALGLPEPVGIPA